MARFLDRLLGRKAPEPSARVPVGAEDEQWRAFYDAKLSALEAKLGPMADVVGHAIIPFQIGGSVDMYYFPEALAGTAFVTMELVEPGNPGPLGEPFEVVAFTRLHFDAGDSQEFAAVETRINGIFTMIGNYSRQEVLKPGETIEMPPDETHDEKCILLDRYADLIVEGSPLMLMLVVEVFRDEMELAMGQGSAVLIERLKSAGVYPYSDLGRQSVV